MDADERLAILKMVEGRQISAEQAADLLAALDAGQPQDSTLPGGTVEEEAWMLTALLQVTEAISGPQAAQPNGRQVAEYSLPDMLERVVRLVALLAGIDRCAVLLWDEAAGAYVNGHAYDSEGSTALLEQLPMARGAMAAFDAVQDTGLPLVLSAGDELAGGPDELGHGPGAASAVLPLLARGRFLGVLLAEYAQRDGLTEKEIALLTNIANQMAVGIENLYLHQEAMERARLERELQVAREVQASLLPRSAPPLAGWEIAVGWKAARAVGGDFHDFITLAGGRLAVVIADVSDKGLGAALFMALARTIVRASLTGEQSGARGLARANRLICADAHDGMFVTLFCGIIDVARQALVYANAGHNPALLLRAGGVVLPLHGKGMALGLVESPRFDECRIPLVVGDVVVMYTDGVTDAFNADDEQFGLDRLRAVLAENLALPAAAIVDKVNAAVSAFVGETPAFDDSTLIVAKYVGIERE